MKKSQKNARINVLIRYSADEIRAIRAAAKSAGVAVAVYVRAASLHHRPSADELAACTRLPGQGSATISDADRSRVAAAGAAARWSQD